MSGHSHDSTFIHYQIKITDDEEIEEILNKIPNSSVSARGCQYLFGQFIITDVEADECMSSGGSEIKHLNQLEEQEESGTKPLTVQNVDPLNEVIAPYRSLRRRKCLATLLNVFLVIMVMYTLLITLDMFSPRKETCGWEFTLDFSLSYTLILFPCFIALALLLGVVTKICIENSDMKLLEDIGQDIMINYEGGERLHRFIQKQNRSMAYWDLTGSFVGAIMAILVDFHYYRTSRCKGEQDWYWTSQVILHAIAYFFGFLNIILFKNILIRYCNYIRGYIAIFQLNLRRKFDEIDRFGVSSFLSTNVLIRHILIL